MVSGLTPMVRGLGMDLFSGTMGYAYGLSGGSGLKATSRAEAYLIDSLAQGAGWQLGKPNFWAVMKGAPFLLSWNPNITPTPKPCYYECITFDEDVPIYGPAAQNPIFEFQESPLYSALDSLRPGDLARGAGRNFRDMGIGIKDLSINVTGTLAWGGAALAHGRETADEFYGAQAVAMGGTFVGLGELAAAGIVSMTPVRPIAAAINPGYVAQQEAVLEAVAVEAFLGGEGHSALEQAGYAGANLATLFLAPAKLGQIAAMSRSARVASAARLGAPAKVASLLEALRGVTGLARGRLGTGLDRLGDASKALARVACEKTGRGAVFFDRLFPAGKPATGVPVALEGGMEARVSLSTGELDSLTGSALRAKPVVPAAGEAAAAGSATQLEFGFVNNLENPKFVLYKASEFYPSMLRPGEYTLNLPNLRGPGMSSAQAEALNWAQNQQALQRAMNIGNPIREMNPFAERGFLQRERDFLNPQGWQRVQQASDYYWVRPAGQ